MTKHGNDCTFPDYGCYKIQDSGNEYLIYKYDVQLHTAYSPEDAEKIMWLMYQLDIAKAALIAITKGATTIYLESLEAVIPDEAHLRMRDVAHHAWVEIITNEDCEVPDVWDADTDEPPTATECEVCGQSPCICVELEDNGHVWNVPPEGL